MRVTPLDFFMRNLISRHYEFADIAVSNFHVGIRNIDLPATEKFLVEIRRKVSF